jgi:hypothetical protein
MNPTYTAKSEAWDLDAASIETDERFEDWVIVIAITAGGTIVAVVIGALTILDVYERHEDARLVMMAQPTKEYATSGPEKPVRSGSGFSPRADAGGSQVECEDDGRGSRQTS